MAAGRIRKVAHGFYQLPRAVRAHELAEAFGGVLSHQSAALAHHWPLKVQPDRPVLSVPRHRRVLAAYRREADFRYADLDETEVDSHVTTPYRTLQDCLRALPFDEALAIADSALRVGGFTSEELLDAARAAPRTGRTQALRVASAANGRAETPFESVVRAIALDIDGLELVPQVLVAPSTTCDLVDKRLRLIVECDSWTYHAEKSAFGRDQERYNDLVLSDWTVVRIGYLHAMERPGYVRDLLARAVRVMAP